MFCLICDYGTDFEIYSNGSKLFVFEDDGDYIHAVTEVFRINSEVASKMSDAELLQACETEYDYSGELNDGSAYCFWKLDMGV